MMLGGQDMHRYKKKSKSALIQNRGNSLSFAKRSSFFLCDDPELSRSEIMFTYQLHVAQESQKEIA